jgi:polysaccharide export outer membrane protein
MKNSISLKALCFVLLAESLAAQQPAAAGGAGFAQPLYLMSPGDQVSVRVANSDDLTGQTFRVRADGTLELPIAGNVKAAGLTAAQLEADITAHLRTYFREPQVSVSLVQTKAPEPIFLVGQFRTTGVYPLQASQTLLQVLAASGGLQPNASQVIRVTRRKDYGPIPLPSARTIVDGSSTVEIPFSRLRDGVSPADDIVLKPYDVLLANRADVIYVSGDVAKPGTIELGDRDSVSLIQVVSLSGGLTKEAARKVRILRPIMDSSRRAEIDIDLNQIYKGEANDFPLLPNDVLFVPKSGSKVALGRTGAIAVALGLAVTTSLAIGLR